MTPLLHFFQACILCVRCSRHWGSSFTSATEPLGSLLMAGGLVRRVTHMDPGTARQADAPRSQWRCLLDLVPRCAQVCLTAVRVWWAKSGRNTEPSCLLSESKQLAEWFIWPLKQHEMWKAGHFTYYYQPRLHIGTLPHIVEMSDLMKCCFYHIIWTVSVQIKDLVVILKLIWSSENQVYERESMLHLVYLWGCS